MLPSRWRLGALAGCGLAVILIAGNAADAAAQITPVRPPPPTLQPPPTLSRQLPTIAAPDLLIDKVQIAQITAPALQAKAFVTMRNAGAKEALFRAGAVVLSAGASDARGMQFGNLVATADFTLAAGQSQVVTLQSLDPCQKGWSPAAVVVRADPQSVIPETQRANNASTVTPAVGDPAASDLVVSSMRMALGRNPQDNRSTAWLLYVTMKNNGSGPALLCPGMTLVRETATPVTAKWPLQSAKFNPPPPAPSSAPSTGSSSVVQRDYMPPVTSIVLAPGATQEFAVFACNQGDLPAGVYEWKAKVNPDGAARESNVGNNEGTAQLQGCN